MTGRGRKRAWRIWLPLLAVSLLVLPFLVHRTTGYYTDGEDLHAPEPEVAGSIREILWEPPTALHGEIARPGSSEYEPCVGPFGEALVFTRGLPGGGADLWISERRRGLWSSPQPVVGVNSDRDELGGAFSSDGSWLYFYSDRPGGLGGYDVWASERLRSGWGEPVNLGPAINSPWNEMSPAPDPRGGRLWFTTDRRAGEERAERWVSTIRARLRSADYEIHVASLDAGAPEESEDAPEDSEGAPAEPVSRLPAAVRYASAAPYTALNRVGSAEGAVAVSPVGDFLYFASNRAGGAGGFDLYRVRLGSGVDVGEIEPLGPQVNTPADELDPALASGGHELYFARTRDGQEDLLVTRSKEVYLTREDEGPYWTTGALLEWIADLIRRAPAWLLGLVISLLVCGVLLLLFRRWLLSPTVVMRCFLIALLLHLMTAFWMNRKKVQRLLLEVVELEEIYEPFEVAVEGMPEESIGFAIREASAATSADTSPTLVARLEVRRLPPPSRRREQPSISEALTEQPDTSILPLADPQSRPEVEIQDDTESPEVSARVPVAAEDGAVPEVDSRLVEPQPEPQPEHARDFLEAERRFRLTPRVEAEAVQVTVPREAPRPPTVEDPEVARERAPRRVDVGRAADARDPAPEDAPVATRETPATSVEISARSVASPSEDSDASEPAAILELARDQPRERREPSVEVATERVEVALRKSSFVVRAVDRGVERTLPSAALAVSDEPTTAGVEAPATPLQSDERPSAPEIVRRPDQVAPRIEDPDSTGAPSLALPRDPAARRTLRRDRPTGASVVSLAVGPVRSRKSGVDDEATRARALPEFRGAGVAPATGSVPAAPVSAPVREGEASTAPAIAGREVEEPATEPGSEQKTRSASRRIDMTAKRSPRRDAGRVSERRGGGIEISRRLTRRSTTVGPASLQDRSRSLASRITRARPLVDDTATVAIDEVVEDDTASSFRPRIYQLRGKDRRQEALVVGGGSESTERAVVAGLEWLASHQSPDGRWTLDRYHRHLAEVSPRDTAHPGWNGKGRKSSIGGRAKAANGDTAATGLALLAFLGHGDSHLEEGVFRERIDRGLRWLVKAQKPDGDLQGGGNMYMHGVAAFALVEAYAFTRDPGLRDPAQRAIDFTASSQVPSKGGWRYQPYPKSNQVDTSVFGWMLMALKSGKLGGLRLPEECLTRAHAYIESARKKGEMGLYVYEPGKGTKRTDLAMTAQGFFAQHILADTVLTEEQRSSAAFLLSNRKSTEYLLKNRPQAKDMGGVNFYYWYYATLAMFQTGGEPWSRWNDSLKAVLLAHQVGAGEGSAAGSWDPRGHRAEIAGRLYSTALSILCLEVYYRYERLGTR